MSQARVLTERELRKVLSYCSNQPHASRNRAMLLCTHMAGMRVGEVAALRICDVLGADGAVMDEIALAEIEVLPYPTEDEFKQAVLTMSVVDPMSISRTNMRPEMLLRWAESMPASSNENFRAFQESQMLQNQDIYGPRPLRILDPFAWSQFIRSIKRGDFKSK